MLFRYSALTFNGHRIHYDQQYAHDVEGYKNLVVHGPLTATLLQDFAQDCLPDSRLAKFEFKGVSPLFCNETLELQAQMDEDDPDRLNMRVLNQSGVLAMTAIAHLDADTTHKAMYSRPRSTKGPSPRYDPKDGARQ
ncbi:acyl-CoA dehydrogenase [Caballeronia glebae]|uniref:Acyl-CoA dehydrogenase n=1 Tax=Caballeronia glebae TaxID=1777143 RepID=A0A158BTA4_9BURK|nr:hypothetical protein [Caballeronia glebae]SAK72497.1 acyl-CoA dehydrogenase [Caballeronia glebae]